MTKEQVVETLKQDFTEETAKELLSEMMANESVHLIKRSDETLSLFDETSKTTFADVRTADEVIEKLSNYMFANGDSYLEFLVGKANESQNPDKFLKDEKQEFQRAYFLANRKETNLNLNEMAETMEAVLTQEQKEKVNQLLENRETLMLFDTLDCYDLQLKKNEDNTFSIHNNEKVFVESFTDITEMLKEIKPFLEAEIADYLQDDCVVSEIENYPHNGLEWQVALTRPDLQGFIENHTVPIAQIVLLENLDSLQKADLNEIAKAFRFVELSNSHQEKQLSQD